MIVQVLDFHSFPPFEDGKEFLQVCLGAGQIESRKGTWHYNWHFPAEIQHPEIHFYHNWCTWPSWLHQEHDHRDLTGIDAIQILTCWVFIFCIAYTTKLNEMAIFLLGWCCSTDRLRCKGWIWGWDFSQWSDKRACSAGLHTWGQTAHGLH